MERKREGIDLHIVIINEPEFYTLHENVNIIT